MKSVNKKSIVYFALAALSVAIAACNTVEGAGKDVSSAGKATERTAEEAKH